jgi:predicted xylose isomerase-like sugar epimerase
MAWLVIMPQGRRVGKWNALGSRDEWKRTGEVAAQAAAGGAAVLDMLPVTDQQATAEDRFAALLAHFSRGHWSD